MSAVFGVVYLDGRPVPGELLGAMSRRLAHRGTDGAGVWVEGSVGIGHRLRHTTPESRLERQPYVRADGSVVLVADARVDDREELIAELGLDRPAAARLSDGALIAEAYLRWGEECFSHILGDFAVVAWDARTRTLVCARDPMGVRPLYYYVSSRCIVFGSEIKALLCVPEVERRLDELQVACYLDGLLHDRERTFYAGIRRVPAAHRLVVRDGRPSLSRYWELDPERELRLGSDGEYAEALREQFTRAVRARLRSTTPVASALSGGLDSSSISVVARDLELAQGRQLHTVSAVFPGLPDDERRMADESRQIDAVLASGGVTPHRLEADRLSPFHELERQLWHLDEAPIGFNMYMHCGLYGLAEAHGARVFLDGYDGDGCVSHGTELLHEMLRLDRWDAFEREVATLCSRLSTTLAPHSYARHFTYPRLDELSRAGRWVRWMRAAREVHARYGVSRRRLLFDHGARPLMARLGASAPGRVSRSGAPRDSLVAATLADRVGLDAHRRTVAAETGTRLPSPRLEHKRSLENPLYQYGLELFDRSAAAFAVEPRYPYFDRRLMEFCLSLPAEQKLNDGWTRAVMRRAMDGLLPPEVRWRVGKQGLSPNFRRGLRHADRGLVETALRASPTVLREFVDADVLDAAAQRFLADGGGKSNPDATMVYRGVALAHWLAGGDWETPAGRGPERPPGADEHG